MRKALKILGWLLLLSFAPLFCGSMYFFDAPLHIPFWFGFIYGIFVDFFALFMIWLKTIFNNKKT